MGRGCARDRVAWSELVGGEGRVQRESVRGSSERERGAWREVGRVERGYLLVWLEARGRGLLVVLVGRASEEDECVVCGEGRGCGEQERGCAGREG